MYSEYEIRQLPLSISRYRQMVEQFLATNGLRLDEVDYYAGVFRLGGDELLAGGGLCGNIIKCIAVDSSLRDEGMGNRLVSHLISLANERGFSNVKLFTKPENRTIFESLSFRMLAESPKAILMETGTSGLDTYLAYLRSYSNRFEEYGKVLQHPYTGVIVMNANPFTRGHRYLVEQAVVQVDTLYVIVVREDRSTFTYDDRLAMVREGCKGLPDVVVLEGSDYAISSATFPTYFLKQLSDASDTQITLDLDLFARHIAPALGATMRFVGNEPTDALTARYNELMRQQLPQRGIEVVQIDRLCHQGVPVSATLLRQSMENDTFSQTLQQAYHSSIPYIIARLASQALQKELDTTPKPGLVDRYDSGAHHDMDYDLMRSSIRALHPYFVRISLLGYADVLPSVDDLRTIGLEAEQAMLRATKGVNTHKGGLFSMGLAVTAAAHAAHKGREIRRYELQNTIRQIANLFPTATGTHGSRVKQVYSVKGALDNARNGYRQLFSDWIDFYDDHQGDPYIMQKTLLQIMSQIDDTNIYYRAGETTARQAKREAADLLADFSEQGLIHLNDEYIDRNISPGGAADMLALTVFIYSMLR